jgi:hypothetical protein
MKLDEILTDVLYEYVGMIDQGSIDMGRLEVLLSMITNKQEARRLAHRIMQQAKPGEVKKALKLGKDCTNRMCYWFVQALEEKPKVKVA